MAKQRRNCSSTEAGTSWRLCGRRSLFGSKSNRLKVLPLDVTDADSISKALAEALETFGAIGVLVSNAGIGVVGAFEATPMTTVREVFETNTFGVMAMTQAVLPLFREQMAG